MLWISGAAALPLLVVDDDAAACDQLRVTGALSVAGYAGIQMFLDPSARRTSGRSRW